MLLITIIIKLETPGPAIFSQERVGIMGRRFTVYKFRSMRQNAESHTGPTWAQENDDRITGTGAILRKTRLDELPQVWNVLRGDMSFVGPRPERPYFVELLKSKIRYYDLRHYVKPGITGWAQVMYRYGASIEDSHRKLEYDLYYAKNTSFKLDLLILLKTIGVVIKGEGR
jgi:lipopolysaccharide/colanic/teichoic acid biosynthesis glycosyltransferase